MELVKYEQARMMLAEAASIDEAKDISDKSAAIQLYAKQHKNVDLENYAAEIKARAARRIGELSKALDKGHKVGQGSDVQLPSTGKLKAETLAAAGLSTSQANRFEAIAELPEEDFEGYIKEKKAQNKPVKITEVENAALAKKREKAAKEKLQAIVLNVPDGLFVGDFREHAKSIPNESIELIFTDPPYDKKSIILFEQLSEIAARVLKPGGSLLAYCGQTQLPEVLVGVSKHLRYWWTHACVHSGSHQLMQKLGIRVGWKPIVWFVKGSRGDVAQIVRDTVSGGMEKDHHKWQQSQYEAEFFIEKLCSKSGVCWDPFAGGGTTIAACDNLKRKWIACEIDKSSASTIISRVS